MESFLSLLNGISPALSTINQHSLGSKICCPHKSSHSKKNCNMNIWMHSFCKNFTAQVFLDFAHPGRETKESDQVFQPLLPPGDRVTWVTLLAGTVVISGGHRASGSWLWKRCTGILHKKVQGSMWTDLCWPQK